MKEIKYQQKYVRQLVDTTIDQKRGDKKGGLVHVSHGLTEEEIKIVEQS